METSKRFCAVIIMALLLTGGCGGFNVKATFEEADNLFQQGNYPAAISKHEQIISAAPASGDRSLFEMGIIHSHPRNGQKDFRKALDCFQRLTSSYPASVYRKDSEMMVFYINNVALKDQTITLQQEQIGTLRQELTDKGGEITALNDRIRALEQKVFFFATQKSPVDKLLIEKKERRLTLIAKGEPIRTYRIALGGNPVGPKERQGDNKTPEGSYIIDSRNKGSRYHLSLHISYPNEKDRKRAQELGVPPGGDIMIHGIKNGFSWVGDAHADVDWTKGCIAVTDEEIEEISRVAPIGTAVEIRP